MTHTRTVLADGLDRLERIRQDAWQAWQDGHLVVSDLNLITEACNALVDITEADEIFFDDTVETLRPAHDWLRDATNAATSPHAFRLLGEASAIVDRLFAHLTYVAAYGESNPPP